MSKIIYKSFSEAFKITNQNLVSEKNIQMVLVRIIYSTDTIGETNRLIKFLLKELAWE